MQKVFQGVALLLEEEEEEEEEGSSVDGVEVVHPSGAKF